MRLRARKRTRVRPRVVVLAAAGLVYASVALESGFTVVQLHAFPVDGPIPPQVQDVNVWRTRQPLGMCGNAELPLVASFGDDRGCGWEVDVTLLEPDGTTRTIHRRWAQARIHTGPLAPVLAVLSGWSYIDRPSLDALMVRALARHVVREYAR